MKNETCSIISKRYVLVTNIRENLKLNITQLARSVSNENDVVTLLGYVNWTLFVYTCEKSLCRNTTNEQHSYQNLCLANKSCCCSNAYHAFVPAGRRFELSNCVNFLQTSAISHWYIFFVFGIVCVFGNFVVIYQKTIFFCRNQLTQKNILIYNILVLNLSIADLLMGIYLMVVSLEIRYKLKNKYFFSYHNICNFLGVISTVSTQTSISILAIISFYRLISLTFPYKTQHVKVVVGIVISIWFIWFIIALLPTIPLEPLATMFTFGISENRKIINGTENTFEITIPLIEDLKCFFSSTKYKEINLVLEKICEYPTRSVLSKLHNRFGWIDIDIDNLFYIGYYDLNYICTINFFFDGLYTTDIDYFNLSFAIINIVISFAIVIAYVFIILKALGSKKKIICVLCQSCKSGQLSFRSQRYAARDVEDQTIFTRITIIIVTDLCFIAPLCLAALVRWLSPLDKKNGDELLKALVDAQSLMLFVVPFNSILNPYIYSFTFWKNCFKNLKKRNCKKLT